MSPLIFLAIPVAIFVIGSCVLWVGSRWRRGTDFTLHQVPDDLAAVAPMLRDQRQTGWQSGIDDRSVRS